MRANIILNDELLKKVMKIAGVIKQRRKLLRLR